MTAVMNDLATALHTLCDALAVPLPPPTAAAQYELRLDQAVLRLARHGETHAVLEAEVLALGAAAGLAGTAQQDLLRHLLACNLARLKGQARPEILSYDERENRLVLWRRWPCDARLAAAVLDGAEGLLNELDFWRDQVATLLPKGAHL